MSSNFEAEIRMSVRDRRSFSIAYSAAFLCFLFPEWEIIYSSSYRLAKDVNVCWSWRRRWLSNFSIQFMTTNLTTVQVNLIPLENMQNNIDKLHKVKGSLFLCSMDCNAWKLRKRRRNMKIGPARQNIISVKRTFKDLMNSSKWRKSEIWHCDKIRNITTLPS